MTHRCPIVLPTIALAIWSVTAHAQEIAPCGINGGPNIGIPPHQINSPLIVTVQITHDQTLSDGNTVHAVAVEHTYRDSQGRIRTETIQGCSIGLDGQMHPNRVIIINDLSNQTLLTWNTNPREHVAHLRPLVTSDSPQAPPLTAVQKTLSTLSTQRFRKFNRQEQLGTQIIAGLAAQGTRQITTIPAGEYGNAMPIEMSEEYWQSRDPRTTLKFISSDPRYGHTVAEVIDISHNEPDPSLFQPPAGYTVQEQSTRPDAVVPAR